MPCLHTSRDDVYGFGLVVLDYRKSERPVRWYVTILQGCRSICDGDAATLEEGQRLAEREALRRWILEWGGP